MSVSIGLLIGMGIMAAHADSQYGNQLDKMPCLEYVMLDGMPYCGVYNVYGTKHEVTMRNVNNGLEIASFE